VNKIALKKLEVVIDLSNIEAPVCDKLLSPFSDNKWILLLNGEKDEIDFELVLDCQLLLVDEPELLKTVKWLVLLSVVDSRATNQPLDSHHSIKKYLAKIMYFIRFLRWQQDIRNPKNATSEMVRDFAQNLYLTTAHNLGFTERFQAHVNMSSGDLSRYVKKSLYPKVRQQTLFNIEYLMFDLGIPTNSWSNFRELADISDSLRVDYNSKGFTNQVNSGKKKSVYALNTTGTVVKQISALNRTLRLATRYPDLLPMMPSDIPPISNSEIRAINKKASLSGKTKDVPFFIMKKAVERSIEFILYYGKPLLEKRDDALEKFAKLASFKPQYNTAELAKEYFRKNPIAVEGYKDSFPPILFTNFDRSTAKTSSEADRNKWSEVFKLRASGWTLKQIADEYKTYKSTISNWIQKHNESHDKQAQNYGLATFLYRHMMVAIEIVLCFFTARRSSEIMSLKAGCISTTESGHWIDMYVAKTYQVNDQFPATNLMKICIELLEEISRPAREITGDHNLWQYKNMTNDDVSQYWFKVHRSAYFEFIGIKDDYLWQFSEHQFRRFFAGVFVNHFGGSVDALRYHLRHTDIAMTFEYLNSTSEDATQEAFTRIAMIDVLEEHNRQSGLFDSASDIGEKFNECAKSITSITENRVRMAYEQFIKEDDIVFEMIEEGLCVGNTSCRKSKSQCISGNEMAHTLTANREQCHGCPNKLPLANWSYKNLEEQCLLNPEDSVIFNAVVANR
jgi:hypothetical protein